MIEALARLDPESREIILLSDVMGLSRAEVEAAFPKIAEFAGIGDFMDRPVKEYSSGMYVRLAFSTAIHVEPEVLIIDEALAVGDAIFANRCVRKLEELKERNVTILFVSHDLGIVKRLADRAALMLHGEIVAMGKPSDIVNRYVGLVHELHLREAPEEGGSYRHGDGTSRIESFAILNSHGDEATSLLSGERTTIRIRALFARACESPTVGILIRNRLGVDVYGTNTRVEQVELGSYAAGDVLEISFALDCLLSRQEYTLTVATQHADGASQDWIDDALSFAVIDHRDTAGMIQLNTEIQWQRNP